jgi:hypothetical protein
MSFGVIDIPVMVWSMNLRRTARAMATSALTKGHTAQIQDKTQSKHKRESPFHTDSPFAIT